MLEERVKIWEEELLIQGRVEGIIRGRVEGRGEGLRSAFRSQFRLKFQRELTDQEHAIVDRAGTSEIERLLGRILTAADPSELFT